MNGAYSYNSSNGYLNSDSFLKTIPAFKKLSADELRQFTQLIHVRWFKKDEPVFYAKEPGIGLYFVHKGAIRLFHDASMNGNSQTSILNRGEFFGELSFLDEKARPYSATAIEETCLIVLFRPDLLRLLDRKPKLGNKILMILNGLVSQQLHLRNEELRQIRENLSNANFIL